MDIGKVIKKYRNLHEMTQEELAEKLAITPQAVSRWENDLSYPDVAMIPKIVEILQVSADELFDTAGLWGTHSPEFAMVPFHVLRNLEYREDSGEEETLNQDQVDCLFGDSFNQNQVDCLFGETLNQDQADCTSKAILIIDDSPFMRNMVSDILGSKGHRIWQSESGEAGLEDLRHHEESGTQFDLCLLDIRMPGMSGIDALKQIRKLYPKVRVVMLSAASTKKNVETAKSLGAAAFVVKPFSADRLMKKV